MAFACFAFLAHAPFLNLPFFWDELGYFVPAALDLLKQGRLVPVSTEANAHPPLVMIYLAAVWKLAGYSITATRVAMLTLASLSLLAIFMLAIELCKQVKGSPAFPAILFVMASPLIYTQSMMAQLDMPAMGLTAATLLLFLRANYRAAAAAATMLVLTKETGIAVPIAMALWLTKERNRAALWFLLPCAVLAGWFAIVWQATGHPFGSAKFTGYNLTYPLHPFRLGVSLAKKLYTLFVADFHWLGTAAIVAAWRGFTDRGWKVAAAIGAAQTLLVVALGGAQLERYLLPVLPLFYIAAATAWSQRGFLVKTAGVTVMSCGLLAGFWWNPPYPYPYENNLAMTTFVELHQAAAEFLERDYPRQKVVTAWPLSDALRRPEFGYVNRKRDIVELPDFQPSRFHGIENVQLLVLYSRDWRRVPLLENWWADYFSYAPAISSEECQRRYGLIPVARWEAHGQWIEILAREPANRSPRPRRFPV
ncbi:MAG: hypothetical protein FJW20_13915 [Acidimicrobiia bacterium]|nr:hypothetical protein [Acidimicrobiia bacterium]